MEITGNQWESQETNKNQEKSMEIKKKSFGNQGTPMEIKGNQRKSRK